MKSTYISTYVNLGIKFENVKWILLRNYPSLHLLRG